ncbi:hypothetical protein [Chryseolinea sp. H1M3-3]|uniref:hypothetical protein n=1 Tax=Chryseolinea sp. H1M3-3 TaxID=3034144 RepID=UPI0023ED03C4|nr:hypothetical protein [Chryseolinea sp. H1M3-3]
METIAFGQWKNESNLLDGVSPLKEDIITIDAQIDVKVRGDLPEAQAMNAATAFMEQKMISFLEYEYEDFKLSKPVIQNGVLNFKKEPETNRAFEQLKSFHLQKFSHMAELKSGSHRRNKLLFSIEPGLEIIIPPYDNDWTNSFVSFSSANKASGSFKAFPHGNGYGASGVGVFLSPQEDVSASFSTHGPVSYAWSNFVGEGGGYAASRGGLGISIYNASRGTLVKDDHEILWSQSRQPSSLEISGGNDDLYFQNTSMGQSHFKMKGGDTYLVWIWSWAFTDSGPNGASFAAVDCKVPFMIVDSFTA